MSLSVRILVAALSLAAVALLGVAGTRWVRSAGLGPVAAAPALSSDSAATVLVVLRPSDCDSYRPLLDAWSGLQGRAGVRVVGSVVDPPGPGPGRDSLRRRLGPDLPLRFDTGPAAEALVLRLGYRRTPVAVLLDRDGRPRAAVPPVRGDRRATAAAEALAAAAGLAAGPGGAR